MCIDSAYLVGVRGRPRAHTQRVVGPLQTSPEKYSVSIYRSVTGHRRLYMKGVVVTGVSTGIGWGTAKVLIRHGIHVFGSVRKQGDAERLAAEFGAAFTPLLFDVTDEMAVQAAAQLVRERLGGETLFGLVNNAGIATAGPLMHQPIEEIRYQI